MNSSRSGMSAVSQTCSGSRPLSPANASSACAKLLGHVRAAGGELVVRAFAGQERPRAPDARSVERAAVGVLAVSVTLIAMPRRTARRVDLERRIDDLHGVHASADHRPRAVRSARRRARRG